MSLLESDRLRIEKEDRESRKQRLETDVNIGKSAERLLNNRDWQRISDLLSSYAQGKRKDISSMVYNVVGGSNTSMDQDHVACNKIRALFQEIYDFEYVINLPKEEMKIGEEALETLRKIREGESKHE